MSPRASSLSRSPLVLFSFFVGIACPATAVADARVSETYGNLPLHFEANLGQAHEDVRFLSRGAGYGLYLTGGEAVLVLARPEVKAQSAVLRMSLVGAARRPLVSGIEELPGKANYFIGKDPAKWRTNVPTYAKVHYREVYPGIDLIYYGNQRQLEYDFVVAPGADPKTIALGFKGADKLEIDAQGDLVLHMGGKSVRQKKPIIYQELDGERQEIAGSYVLRSRNRVGFKVVAYDTSRPLVIDPVVLSYSTYLGGSGNDRGNGIAVDADGNAYVTGVTNSTNFPTTSGAVQSVYGGGPFGDAFVTKINPSGTALVYSTYLGGGNNDTGWGIAVDADGNAFVSGGTDSINFPTTAGAFQPSFSGGFDPLCVCVGSDAFVAKLNPTGSALVYSTYLGGSGTDVGFRVAVDAVGNAYLTGMATSTNFPMTVGAFRTIGRGVFVTKINPGGSALVYSTYLGNGSDDQGLGIAVDADGSAYVTGHTGGWFPTTPGAFQPVYPGGFKAAFVTKVHSTGSALVYSTYLGGRGGGGDLARGITIDTLGDAYVTGDANSADFPTTPHSFQPVISGQSDAFVTKLNATGSSLVYSTFLGGSGGEGSNGIAVDAHGNAYVTGQTGSGDFPTTPDASRTGSLYVTKLNSKGSGLIYSTRFGGSGTDKMEGIAVDGAGNAYVTGYTGSADFPTTAGAFQPASSGDLDAFVAMLPTPTPTPTPTRFEESAATYAKEWLSYGAEMGTFSGGTIVASNQATATATFSFTGTAVSWIGVKCNVCGIATVSIDGGAPATVNTFGPGVPGSLVSEPVFSASGLAPDVTHTLVITVTGTGLAVPNSLIGGNSHVAVDAFDVTINR